MNINVLLVEDQLSKRLRITEAFHDLPVTIESALNFARARDLLNLKKFDWVIAELKVKYTDGESDGLQLWNISKHLQPDSLFVLLTDDPFSLTSEHMMNRIVMPPVLRSPVDPGTLRHMLISRNQDIWTKRAA